jgi:hypothetical protein
MDLTAKPTITPGVMTRQLGEDIVVLDLSTGTYFGMDAVGARIWQLMSEGLSLAEICTQMLAEYDVTNDAMERDILELADTLFAQKLIGF